MQADSDETQEHLELCEGTRLKRFLNKNEHPFGIEFLYVTLMNYVQFFLK